MVYIQSWQQFQDAAETLYQKSPNKARYCVKWRSSEGKLVLKITDDVTCLKFKTYSSIYLNRFEALNLSLMAKMQNKRVVENPSEPSPNAPRDSGVVGSVSSAVPTPSPSAAGGVKKKKPAKKKK